MDNISVAVTPSVFRHGVKCKKDLYPCARHTEQFVKERKVGKKMDLGSLADEMS